MLYKLFFYQLRRGLVESKADCICITAILGIAQHTAGILKRIPAPIKLIPVDICGSVAPTSETRSWDYKPHPL